jgi:putative transposase
MDEVFIRIQGVQHYLWCAVDQDGVVLDILFQARRDALTVKRSSNGCGPDCNMSHG